MSNLELLDAIGNLQGEINTESSNDVDDDLGQRYENYHPINNGKFEFILYY